MAEDKIKHSDLIEDQVFKPTIESGKNLLSVLEQLEAGFKENLAASQEFFSKAVPKSAKDLEKFAAEVKKVSDNEKGLNETLKTQEQVKKNLKKLTDAELAQNAIDKKNLRDRVDLIKAGIVEQNKATGTIQKLEAANKRLRAEVRGLDLDTKHGAERAKELNAQINKNTETISKNSDHLIRNKMNVGNYTASIKDALKNTGLFNNGIGRLVITLNNLKKQQDEAAGSAQNFTNLLKLGLLAIAVVAIAAAKELLELNQQIIDNSEILLAQGKDIGTNSKAFETLIRATIEWRKQLRVMSLQLQQVSLDEKDFNEIAADTTIGFEERNDALKRAIELGKQRAAISAQVASVELALIEQEIIANEKLILVGKGNARNELLDKKLEAQKKLNEALDVQGDLERQNAERVRQQNIERATTEIDLILKKKQSANAEKVILENQLQDERRQLEERRKINEELLNVNRKTTAEEISLFKKFVKVQFDESKLLSTTDAVLLKQRLESIRTLEGKGLGEQAIVELSKIIKQAQENQIANAQTIVKLNEEDLKRKQKIAQIEREIAQLNLQDQIGDTEKLLEDRVKAYEEANDKIFKGDNLFNKELRNKRQREFDFEIGLIASDVELKKEQAKKNAENEIQNVRDSVNDNKIKAEEIKKINEKLQIDLGNIQDDASRKEKEANKKKLEDDKKLNDALIEHAYQRLKAISDGVSQGLAEGSKKRQEALDKDIEMNATAIDRQLELAQNGKENQLAFEEKKRAELSAQLEREKAKEQKREEALQLANVFLEFLKERAKSEPNSAPARALADTLIARAISRQIAGAFADGVEGFKGKGTGKSDSNLIAFSNGESVVTEEGTKENPGLVTAINKGMVNEYFKEKFNADNILIPQDSRKSVESGIVNMLNKRILSLEETVKNKKELNVEWDQLGRRIETKIENGMKEIRVHITTGKDRL